MEHRTDLLRLLSSLCDEQLTEAEQSRLEELLNDTEARRLYLQYVDMHARLLTHPAVAGEASLPGVDALAAVVGDEAQAAIHRVQRAAPDIRQTERQRGRSLQFLSYVAVAAATLAATILVQVALKKSPQPAGAQILPT